MFRPYRESFEVTIFGSAQTESGPPFYAQARDLAAALADEE
jgi:predicted Rossmann-fold nucleotide-binding protein